MYLLRGSLLETGKKWVYMQCTSSRECIGITLQFGVSVVLEGTRFCTYSVGRERVWHDHVDKSKTETGVRKCRTDSTNDGHYGARLKARKPKILAI